MIIAFDATAIGSGLGGDETLVRSLLLGLLDAMQPHDRLQVLCARGAQLPVELESHPGCRIDRITRRSGPLHFSLVLPAWLARLRWADDGRNRPDIIVTNTHAPLIPMGTSVLMVPDLSFVHQPGGYPRSTRLRLRTLVPYQSRRAALVLTISEFCRRDLIASYGLAADRVAVVPLAVDAPSEPIEEVRARLRERGVTEPYLLYLGNLHPRKNVPRVIRSFLALRGAELSMGQHRLVVAGRTWFGGTAEREAAADAPEGAVVFLDRVDDAEREVLLHDAQALVYLSTFEGFGLPPLEAMVRGTPVVASNTTAIPEVCGSAALLVDPLNDRDIIDALRLVATQSRERQRLAEAGRARAREFSIGTTGTAVYGALECALSDNRGGA